MLKKILRKLGHAAGLEISAYRPQAVKEYGYVRNEEMIQGLIRSKMRSFQPTTIIDIGAAEGSWTLSCQEIWPDANYVLFEPLEERAEALKKLVQQNKKFHFVAAGAGKEQSVKHFYVSGDLDGSAVVDEPSTAENIRVINITSVDHEISAAGLPGPYLLKLDTHGFEVPIFEGALETLKNTELIIVEVYGFNLTKDSLLFFQMTDFLDKYGFRMVDMVDVMRRQKDGAFWQADAFYLKKDNVIFNDNVYN